MCESVENLYCQKCQDITNHLLSGSATKAWCLGCGDQKKISPASIYYPHNKQTYEFYAIKLKRLKEV